MKIRGKDGRKKEKKGGREFDWALGLETRIWKAAVDG